MHDQLKNKIASGELIDRLHNGDERALSSLFDQFHGALLWFALQYTKEKTSAEDFIAESFIRVWERKKDFFSVASIRSFLYTAVRNASINHLKKIAREELAQIELNQLSEEIELADSRMIKAELIGQLWRDIEKLPPARKRIFKMIYAEGLSIFEIATILKISVDTVRVQKARALHTLRALQARRSGSNF